MLSKILAICEDLQCDISLDNKPKDYYFELKYEDKVIVSLVKIYQYMMKMIEFDTKEYTAKVMN